MDGTVLVTGASRGLGLEFARQYGTEGWTVHACCRDPRRATALRDVASKSDGRVLVHRLDVGEEAQVAELASALRGHAIDVLLNNAGVYGPERDGFGAPEVGAWLEVFRVNAIAPLVLSHALVENVASSRRRTIATVSSLMGSLEDNSSGGHYAYRSSKAAANMVVRSMALDLRGRGIIAVALNPGWVRTDMGGPEATLSAAESVAGMRRVIAGLTAEDSGLFFDHDGETLPW